MGNRVIKSGPALKEDGDPYPSDTREPGSGIVKEVQG